MFEILHFVVGAWWLPVLVAAIIVWWAWRSFRDFKAKIEPLKAAISSATQALLEVRDPRSLTTEYEAISRRLTDDPVLGSTWVEFESTLILPTDVGFVKNARRPSEYFNDGLYYKGGINLRDFESIPNQLVGWGLLATFVGLVLSLLIAKQGIGADIATAKVALGDLLNAAAFKFITSVAALASSVIYTGNKNRLLHEADELIEQFCRELERLTVQVTSESLAEDARKELAAQTTQLERFNSELAVSIAEALDRKLRDSLSLAMQPVASEIGKLAERLGEINQDALEQMVDRFSNELSGAAREHTDQMARMLQAAAESIAAVPNHIDAAGERFSEQIRAGAEELTVSMTAAAENVDATLQGSTRGLAASIDASSAKMGEIASEMENSLAQQEAFAGKLAAAHEVMSNRLQSLLAASEGTAAQVAALAIQVTAAGDAAEGLAALAPRVAEAAKSLADAADQVADLTTHTEQLNANATDTVQRLADRISHLEREISSMNNALSAAFDKVAGGVGQFGEKTTGFVKELDKALADALGRLSGAVQQLDEVLGEMPKKSDFAQLTKAINATRNAREAAE